MKWLLRAEKISILAIIFGILSLPIATAQAIPNHSQVNTSYLFSNEIKDNKLLLHEAEKAVADDKYQLAEQRYRQILERDSSNEVILLRLGNVLRWQGWYEEAIDYYNQAISLNSQNDYSHRVLGYALHRSREYPEAIKAYEESIRLNPEDSNTYNNLGIVHENLDNVQAAINAYSEAVNIDSNNISARRNLGEILADQGQSNVAIKHFEKILDLDSTYLRAYIELGDIFSKQELFSDAIDTYSKAFDETGEHCNQDLVAGLQSVYLKQAQFRKAIELRKSVEHCDFKPQDNLPQSWTRSIQKIYEAEYGGAISEMDIYSLTEYILSLITFEQMAIQHGSYLAIEPISRLDDQLDLVIQEIADSTFDDPEIQTLHAILLFYKGDESSIKKALQIYSQSLQNIGDRTDYSLDSSFMENLYYLASLLIIRGYTNEVIAATDIYLKQHKELSLEDFYTYIGLSLAQAGRFKLSRQFIEKTINPEQDNPWFIMSGLLSELSIGGGSTDTTHIFNEVNATIQELEEVGSEESLSLAQILEMNLQLNQSLQNPSSHTSQEFHSTETPLSTEECRNANFRLLDGNNAEDILSNFHTTLGSLNTTQDEKMACLLLGLSESHFLNDFIGRSSSNSSENSEIPDVSMMLHEFGLPFFQVLENSPIAESYFAKPELENSIQARIAESEYLQNNSNPAEAREKLLHAVDINASNLDLASSEQSPLTEILDNEILEVVRQENKGQTHPLHEILDNNSPNYNLKRSTVAIHLGTQNNDVLAGSGVVIHRSEKTIYILTAKHILLDSFSELAHQDIRVEFYSQYQPNRQRLKLYAEFLPDISLASGLDLAILKVVGGVPDDIKAIKTSSNLTSRHQNNFITIGHPLGRDRWSEFTSELQPTSLYSRELYLNLPELEQTKDAQGLSGGGVWDSDGNLAGLVYATDSDEKLIKAYSIDTIHSILELHN